MFQHVLYIEWPLVLEVKNLSQEVVHYTSIYDIWKFNKTFTFFFKYSQIRVGKKSSYDKVRSAVGDFLDQWGPSTVTLMKEVCGLPVEK